MASEVANLPDKEMVHEIDNEYVKSLSECDGLFHLMGKELCIQFMSKASAMSVIPIWLRLSWCFIVQTMAGAKSVLITGLYSDWGKSPRSFKPTSPDNIAKNKLVQISRS